VILLDTCTFVWLCADPDRLSPGAREALGAAGARILFSDVSALEISLKWSAGKIELPKPPRYWVEENVRAWALESVGMEREDVYRAAELAPHHRDPFDRLLVAAALRTGATLLTPDEAVRRYPVSAVW